MTLQEPVQNQYPNAQEGFQATQEKPDLAIVADEERQNRQRIAILRIKERNTAKSITNAERPVIIITEEKAASYGALYKRLNDALPNIPVVFENKNAMQKFERAPFSMMNEFNHRVVGHFEKIDGYRPTSLCSEIKKSDCVIVLGQPQSDLKKELDRHGDYITGDTVNLSLIETMKRKTDAWTTWNTDVQRRPSL